jgi:hypothetical protein
MSIADFSKQSLDWEKYEEDSFEGEINSENNKNTDIKT